MTRWLWTVATPDTTVYAIQSDHGFPKPLLGENFAGVIIRDGWAPSRRFTQAVHQTCLAQPIRRCRLPQAEHPRVWRGAASQQILASVLRTAQQRRVDVSSIQTIRLRSLCWLMWRMFFSTTPQAANEVYSHLGP